MLPKNIWTLECNHGHHLNRHHQYWKNNKEMLSSLIVQSRKRIKSFCNYNVRELFISQQQLNWWITIGGCQIQRVNNDSHCLIIWMEKDMEKLKRPLINSHKKGSRRYLNQYLLPTQFEVCILSYWPRVFPLRFTTPVRSVWAINLSMKSEVL